MYMIGTINVQKKKCWMIQINDIMKIKNKIKRKSSQ